MYKSVDVKTYLPEPHDLFGVPLVMPVYSIPLPVIHIHFLHTTQHQLLKKIFQIYKLHLWFQLMSSSLTYKSYIKYLCHTIFLQLASPIFSAFFQSQINQKAPMVWDNEVINMYIPPALSHQSTEATVEGPPHWSRPGKPSTAPQPLSRISSWSSNYKEKDNIRQSF